MIFLIVALCRNIPLHSCGILDHLLILSGAHKMLSFTLRFQSLESLWICISTSDIYPHFLVLNLSSWTQLTAFVQKQIYGPYSVCSLVHYSSRLTLIPLPEASFVWIDGRMMTSAPALSVRKRHDANIDLLLARSIFYFESSFTENWATIRKMQPQFVRWLSLVRQQGHNDQFCLPFYVVHRYFAVATIKISMICSAVNLTRML